MGIKLDRFICDVFHDMRTTHETRNYSYLLGLIEEAQSYAYRMENGLNATRETASRMFSILKRFDPETGNNYTLKEDLLAIIRDRYNWSDDNESR